MGVHLKLISWGRFLRLIANDLYLHVALLNLCTAITFDFEREARYDFRGNELKVLMWRANKDTKPNGDRH